MASTGAVAIVHWFVTALDGVRGCPLSLLFLGATVSAQRVFIGPRYAGQPILVASKHTSAAGQPSEQGVVSERGHAASELGRPLPG